MSRLARGKVRDVAKLARIRLSESEEERMSADLEQILDYAATLQELDTEGIDPTSHAIPLATPMREDRAVPGIDPELAVANAPASIGTAFLVPKVIEGEEEAP